MNQSTPITFLLLSFSLTSLYSAVEPSPATVGEQSAGEAEAIVYDLDAESALIDYIRNPTTYGPWRPEALLAFLQTVYEKRNTMPLKVAAQEMHDTFIASFVQQLKKLDISICSSGISAARFDEAEATFNAWCMLSSDGTLIAPSEQGTEILQTIKKAIWLEVLAIVPLEDSGEVPIATLLTKKADELATLFCTVVSSLYPDP